MSDFSDLDPAGSDDDDYDWDPHGEYEYEEEEEDREAYLDRLPTYNPKLFRAYFPDFIQWVMTQDQAERSKGLSR